MHPPLVFTVVGLAAVPGEGDVGRALASHIDSQGATLVSETSQPRCWLEGNCDRAARVGSNTRPATVRVGELVVASESDAQTERQCCWRRASVGHGHILGCTCSAPVDSAEGQRCGRDRDRQDGCSV